MGSWEKDIVGMVEEKHGKHKISVSFDCETLKAEKAAEDHIKQFMPKLAGLDAVGMYRSCFCYFLFNISYEEALVYQFTVESCLQPSVSPLH